MIGLMVLLVLCVWMFLANVIAKYILSHMQLDAGKKKTLIHIGLYILVFIAPVADEIIGGFQFRAMCMPENLLIYDENKLKSRSVVPRDVPLQTIDKVIPIVVSTGQWEDHKTGELLVTYKLLHAKGGWLSRLIGFPEGNAPFTFDGYCGPKGYYSLFEKLNVTKIKK